MVTERIELVRQHPDFQANISRVLDVSDCEIEISTDDIRSLIENISRDIDKRGSYKEAIVVNSQLAHGMVRIYESVKPFSQIEVQVFNGDNPNVWAEVRSWLGLAPDIRLPEFLTGC